MDAFAQTLLAFPPDSAMENSLVDDLLYDSSIRTHASRVYKMIKGNAGAIAAHALQLLEHLNPAVHTYSYLALLESILPANSALYDSIEPAVAEKMLIFLLSFDQRQVRYCGVAFTQLFSAVGSGRILPASVAVDALAYALQRLDPSGSVFTSNHLLLAKLAYHTNNAAAALPALGREIFFFPGPSSPPLKDAERLCSTTLAPPSYINRSTGLTLPVRSTQVLEFDHLVGLLYCSVSDWAGAHAAFERVVVYPTRELGISRIMTEAHKKWLLTGLLQSGKVDSVPANVGDFTAKVLLTRNKTYVQMAESFGAPDATAMINEAAMGEAGIVADGNESLTKAVFAAHPKWQIARLRDVYTTVSVGALYDVIKHAPPETVPDSNAGIEALVQDMIDTGMLRAVIHRPPIEKDKAASAAAAAAPESSTVTEPYLEFLPEVEEMSEEDFASAMTSYVQRIRVLLPMYKATDEQMSLNREYLRAVIREQKREKDTGNRDAPGGAAGGDSLYYDADPDDEDLMTDFVGA